ncbi:hypothetical protein BC829DRAFT_378397, partial [Chytridium lagenaria]
VRGEKYLPTSNYYSSHQLNSTPHFHTSYKHLQLSTKSLIHPFIHTSIPLSYIHPYPSSSIHINDRRHAGFQLKC